MKPAASPGELARIEQWMQSVITHPEGVQAGLVSPAARAWIDVAPDRVEAVICRSEAQTSLERLHVYANAYYARLLEVFRSEFPALAHALGEDLFRNFAFAYLQAHPSQSYTLSDLGAKFPEHLARTRPPRETVEPDWADFLVDLATLERTYGEVFDGPGVERQRLLQAEDIQSIAPDEFFRLRLVPVPCLKLLTLRFAVHEYASAVRRKESPTLPLPSPVWLVVTRRDYVVRRVAVSEAEIAALKGFVDGGTVGDSLKAAQAQWSGDPEQLALTIRRWFHDWSAAGYFQRIDC